ncbi:[protein-PII] uridylyltransferase [Methylotenera versatilis]|uniref:[protein-PII] uridylyltransferase n=1 Tax=Methylotenera versatilis TaxID=1055487 RepID=UPI0006466A16|nr:[protein-PII] uridylyltransferase [Methylotenera versatilis]
MAPQKNQSKKTIQTWRDALKVQQNALETAFYQHKNTALLLKQQSLLIDQLLKKIWLETNINADTCLIAVGGYGRQLLFPYSDIDLLILLPDAAPQALSQEVESLIGLLWDIGLNVGHSVRTLQECVDEAANDVTVQTNLSEARLLCGKKRDYQVFLKALDNTMHPASYFAAKFKEQDNRHAKFNDTTYNLEPNIKESPGGLRDLHMILWLAQSQNLGKNWASLARNNIISMPEVRQIKRHERNLQNLRIRLHYLAKRREDRLLFDFQNTLASDLGYVNTLRKRASEQLMQSYYTSAKFINLINEILLKTFRLSLNQTKPKIMPINARFEAHDDLLEIKTANVLQQQPNAILEGFLLLQKHPQLTGMSANLIRELQRVKKIVNHDFRQSKENKNTFLAILSQADGVNHSLRRMNRYGILGQYIPAFGKIVGQMQHDLFHVYTVDEHILNVLANLRRYAKHDLKHEFPLCSELFSNFEKPYLLYLAALFHDIAKGRNGDHSSLGTIDARRFCKLHGLAKEEVDLVAWLVDAHLKMSSTAQKSDLSDPEVIQQFANLVKTEKRLIALYLLTVADIRGTSPVVWNAWKARLLESLFYATRSVLKNVDFSKQKIVESRQQEAAEKLTQYGLKPESYLKLWENTGVDYFVRFESDEIAWQSRLLTPHVFAEKPIVRARLGPNGDGIQVMIYTRNQDDLFARICNFFDRMAYNIVQAKIYTTNHGYALNNFIILDQSYKSVSYSGLLKFIETQLTIKISSSGPLESPLQGRISRQVKYMSIQPQIKLTAETQGINHTLEIVAGDRPGLLAKIANIFLQQAVDLHNAKINTLGNRAEDSFLISAKHNQPLNPIQIEQLTQNLSKL